MNISTTFQNYRVAIFPGGSLPGGNFPGWQFFRVAICLVPFKMRLWSKRDCLNYQIKR